MMLNRTELRKYFSDENTIHVIVMRARTCKYIKRTDIMTKDSRGGIRCIPSFELEDFISGLEKHNKEIRADHRKHNMKLLRKMKEIRNVIK